MRRLDVPAVNRALLREHVHWTLRYQEVCDSTQDLARSALQTGVGAGTLFVTDWQRKGRGRYGRPWSAPQGHALLFSTILFPPEDLIGMVPLLAGVAVSGAIEGLTAVQCDLKWPNDVLAGARKVAGILAERPPGPAVVLGVGINVNVASSDLPDTDATSLLVMTGRQVSREELLASTLNAVDSWYGRALREGPQTIIRAWRLRTSMLGRTVAVVRDGATRLGIAEDIDDNGRLMIQYEDGRREALIAGEISRIRSTK